MDYRRRYKLFMSSSNSFSVWLVIRSSMLEVHLPGTRKREETSFQEKTAEIQRLMPFPDNPRSPSNSTISCDCHNCSTNIITRVRSMEESKVRSALPMRTSHWVNGCFDPGLIESLGFPEKGNLSFFGFDSLYATGRDGYQEQNHDTGI